MPKVIDKHMILAMGCLFLIDSSGLYKPVIAFLIAIISLELSLYFESEYVFYGIVAVYAAACIFMPLLVFFLPVHIYEFAYRRLWWGYGLCIFFVMNIEIFNENWKIALWIMILLLASLLGERTPRQMKEHKDFLFLQDKSAEEKSAMDRKNKELLEKQDYEINVATLSERNRIAREIHDNVGHMLSRCILQLGALMVVHKNDENIYNQLSSVNESLNEAMNSIRESVHDLHNESVDLKQSVLAATSAMQKDYNLRVDYDISDDVPRNVKYAMIAIVKEAMSNIVKHSDATDVTVMLREHPAFYQLLIEDNGTNINPDFNSGIGLSNMIDRVQALGGTINFKTDTGFSIMISIKKE